MSIETWSPGQAGHGWQAGPKGLSGTQYDLMMHGGVRADDGRIVKASEARPAGDGWQLTGYKPATAMPHGRTTGAQQTYSVPIYTRNIAPPPAPAPAPAPEPQRNPYIRSADFDKHVQARDRAQRYLSGKDEAKSPYSALNPMTRPSFDSFFGGGRRGTANRGTGVKDTALLAENLYERSKATTGAMDERATASNSILGERLREFANMAPKAPDTYKPDQLIALANRMNREITIG